RTYPMKTNNYWSAIVLTVLITEVVFSTALYSLPGPDDYKKTADDVKKASAAKANPVQPPGPEDYKKLQDGVNKAYLQNEADKAAAAAKANPAPAQEVHVRAQSETSAKPIGLDDVLTGDYQQVPSQNGPASKPGAQSEASSTSTQKTNMPFTFYDRYT